MNQLPVNLYSYFWDTRAADLDPSENQKYIIERLLRLGDLEAWRWLKKTYSDNEIVSVVKTSRQLSKKDAAFYSLIFQIPAKDMRCNQLA